MKAIVLSAGQGRRLLPLTTANSEVSARGGWPADRARAPARGARALRRSGRSRWCSASAPSASRAILARRCASRDLRVETLFNPFFASSDNLDDLLARARRDGRRLRAAERRHAVRGPRARSGCSNARARPDHRHDRSQGALRRRRHEGRRSTRAGACSRSARRCRPRAVGGESIGMLCFRGTGREVLPRRARARDAPREGLRAGISRS